MSDWDVDKYKNDYESEEHWELKRQFMEMHKDKFSEGKIIN
jgi:XRN-Two Binding Domain, XTBD